MEAPRMTRQEILRQMIDDYRKKIELYQTMIREWEIDVGLQPSAQVPQMDEQKTVAAGKQEAGSDLTSLVREWQFFKRSQPEAAKAFLELVDHPVRTGAIVEAIEKGGVKVGGDTPERKRTNLYTILSRSDDFVRVAKDTWALAGWPGVPKREEVGEAEEKANGQGNEK
jgi:hypothetical protein